MNYTGYDKSLHLAATTIVGILIVSIVNVWAGKPGVIALLATAIILLAVFLTRFLIKKKVQG